MTERQAWKTIADAYATPRGERTIKQKKLVSGGVCRALMTLKMYNHLTERLRLSMRNKVMESTICIDDAYFCKLSPANDILRAMYCYFMYYATKKAKK